MLYGFFLDLHRSMGIALLPTLKAIVKDPLLIVKPLEVRRMYMAHVWSVYGDGIDESSKREKEKVVRANASGIVLDMGAGGVFVINDFNPSFAYSIIVFLFSRVRPSRKLPG